MKGTRIGRNNYGKKALSPALFWLVMRSLEKSFADTRAAHHLIPRGNPGSGVIRGRDNVAKSVTYRATYVPGGFNVARDARRSSGRLLREIN